MKTYPEMNAKITNLLRMSENPRCIYAAARIEELEKKIAELTADHIKTEGNVQAATGRMVRVAGKGERV